MRFLPDDQHEAEVCRGIHGVVLSNQYNLIFHCGKLVAQITVVSMVLARRDSRQEYRSGLKGPCDESVDTMTEAFDDTVED